MSEKRKDNKGRILRTGESQRKDLRYQYRYVDNAGNRKTVYATDLHELRAKENEIERDNLNGISHQGANITIAQLVSNYIETKKNLKYNTMCSYNTVLNKLNACEFGSRKIKEIRASDAKKWFISLHDEGLKYGSIRNFKMVIQQSFQAAINDEIITKNPFDFSIASILTNDSNVRQALTQEQQNEWLSFLRSDSVYSKLYDINIVLLGTGMRIGEFCGLTVKDIDFQNRCIRVERQLQCHHDGTLHIETPKTKSGKRTIPISDDVVNSLHNILKSTEQKLSNKSGDIVDGCSGFILVNHRGHVPCGRDIDSAMRRALKKYNNLHPNSMLPTISPHVLRHTFCSNLANAGVQPKALQYVMGHSNISITMNVYTHVDYSTVEKQMRFFYDAKP